MRPHHLLTVVSLTCFSACGGDGGGDAGVDGNELRPDSDGDIDFDGVPDISDNCPTASNSFQGNEDGDAFGDACDPCPVVAGNTPADGDGDGVADACDPKPIIIGDKIAFFEGFHQGVPQGWDKVGTWTTGGDQLSGTSAGAGHFSLIVTDRTRETLTARITVTTLTGSTHEIGLVDNKIANGSSAIACVMTGTELAVLDTGNPAGATTTAHTITEGTTYQLSLQRENNSYTCSVAGGPSVTASFSLQNAQYQSGFTLTGASIKADWFMVVESL